MALLDLFDYRRRVQEIYASVRASPDAADAWRRWRVARDELFGRHPQSALEIDDPRRTNGLAYFEYDPAWRVEVPVEPVPDALEEIGHGDTGATLFRRHGVVRFQVGTVPISLTVYWLDTYGGGLFLPFRDATNGIATYEGGRYLLDSAKGADLGSSGDRLTLDFNFAYHPSCVYSPRWSCPLAPRSNVIDAPVRAGERL